jgi:3-carboxy-cis,cis-muconate cycloisomerase
MLLAMPQEQERGLGMWQAEWEIIPEAFRLTSASIAYGIDLTENLEVRSDRMQANLHATLGLPLAESISAALVPKIGRTKSHELLRKASAKARQQSRQLSEVLNEMPEVTAHLTASDIERLFDPRNYLGSTRRFIARVLGDDDAHD